MVYTDTKKNKNIRLKQFISGVADKCKQGRLSQKSIVTILRTLHMSIPIIFVFMLLYASHFICIFTILVVMSIIIMFYIFDGCWLSMLEQELYNDNFSIIDPFLEIFNMEINNKNRKNISIINAFVYILTMGLIYYIRFSTIKS